MERGRERGYNTTERGRVEGRRWAAAAERIKGWRSVINAKTEKGREWKGGERLKKEARKKRGDRQANHEVDRLRALPLVVD